VDPPVASNQPQSHSCKITIILRHLEEMAEPRTTIIVPSTGADILGLAVGFIIKYE